MCSDCLSVHRVLSQGCHRHAPATSTQSTWPDSTRDTNDRLQDATARDTVALLGLQPCHLWACQASQDWWQHIIQHIWDNEQWLEALCMTRAIFRDILEKPQPHL
ncbi:hypothetical protein Y1Q_0020217 [Alligator mississippiensis]|uniref:Uncharacterized protein n=1 Tax=Alligator mississippiensis TaxID=8496 RepID=A0A151PJ38_ALLMI|nr:hypothetical protein Y1Q_0020217 [Alligator mississippiensis]